jgi:curli biogenesis system outer membrane secretion channel CsgG
MHLKPLTPTPLVALLALTLAIVGSPSPVSASDTGAGGLRYTVMVNKVDNRSHERTLGDGLKAVLTSILNESGHFITIGEADMREAAMEEQAFGATGATKQGNKTPIRGQMTPAQLLVKVTINEVKYDASTNRKGFGIGKVRLGGGGKSTEIATTLQMIDSGTGMVMASKNFNGDAKSKGRSFSFAGLKKVFNRDVAGDFNETEADSTTDAMIDAMGQAVEWMVDQLPSVPWRGEVVKIVGDKVIINRGDREGVANGQIFIVGEAEMLRDPDTGEVLDVSTVERGRLRVTRVRDRIAYCEVISGDVSLIYQGMGIEPAWS